MPACQQPAELCSQQGRACACAAMQLLAAMQLRGSGTGPGQATAPGALDHGPYGPQGPWAQIKKNKLFFRRTYFLQKHTNTQIL